MSIGVRIPLVVGVLALANAVHAAPAKDVPQHVAKPTWHTAVDTDLARPAVADKTLVFGGNDSRYRAIDLGTGKILWESRRKGEARLHMTPTVDGGLVFLGYINGEVHALNPRSGEPRWVAVTRGLVEDPPLVTSDGVYVLSNEHDEASKTSTLSLWKLGKNDGMRRWRFVEKLGEGTSQAWNESPPILVGDEVLLSIGSHGDDRGVDDVRLVAFDAATGKEKWNVDGVSLHNGRYVGGVIVAYGKGNVFAWDPKTKETVWTIETQGWMRDGVPQYQAGDPAPSGNVAGNTIYLVRNYRDANRKRSDQPRSKILAVDVKTGKTVWEIDSDRVEMLPACVGDRVIVGTHQGVVQGLDAETGKVVWSRKPGPDPKDSGMRRYKVGAIKSCAGTHDTVYCTDDVGFTMAFAAKDGGYQWVHYDNKMGHLVEVPGGVVAVSDAKKGVYFLGSPE